jgi:hypothetical protein
MTDIELRIKNKVKHIENRIINLINREKNRREKDAAGVYIPTSQDAAIRGKAFEECLKIVRSEQ